jgi:hypothetical protein
MVELVLPEKGKDEGSLSFPISMQFIELLQDMFGLRPKFLGFIGQVQPPAPIHQIKDK